MLEIGDFDLFVQDYFSLPENQQKAKKACEHYDRLLMQNIRRSLSSSAEKIDLAEIEKADSGKCLEKAKYEWLSSVSYQGEKGRLRLDLLQQTAAFFPDRKQEQ